MSSIKRHELPERIADVLGSVRKKGVRLWSENGRLHYKAPKGAITEDEIERLRVSSGQIVAFLEGATVADAVEPRLEHHRGFARVPLAFSQLSRWRLMQLGEVPCLRRVASATRLRGRLNVDALRRGIAEIVRRHDALRTRIVVWDGIPTQEIDEAGGCELELDDLTAIPERFREVEVKRLTEELILTPIDIAVGPLFGVRLLRVHDDEHVLIVAMEHMISDGFSLNILERDLFSAYTQALKGRAFSLPEISMQFADYAVWQRNAEKSWVDRHAAYWSEHLTGCQRLRFPEDQSLQTTACPGWGKVRLHIMKDLKAQLREWCRLRGTTLVISVLTAYVGLVLRWCNASESVIQYQFDGRVSPKIEHTIGFFASALYLRITLDENDNFVDLMNRVTKEYCKALEHADFSYLAAQLPRPEFTRNSLFNWIPQGSANHFSDLDGSDDSIKRSPLPFAHPTVVRNLGVDNEPSILLVDADDGIVGDVYFPLNRFSVGTMERFGRNFLVFLGTLLRQPEERVKDICFCK